MLTLLLAIIAIAALDALTKSRITVVRQKAYGRVYSRRG